MASRNVTALWVPLWGCRGVIRDWTLVDAEDYEWGMTRCWHLNGEGYAVSGTYPTIRMHRMLMGLVPFDGLEADHINRDKLDNRRENLRVGPDGMNQQNLPANRTYACKPTSSRFRGVSAGGGTRRGKWRAYVNVGGVQRELGYFTDEAEAARVAAAARRELMPFATD